MWPVKLFWQCRLIEVFGWHFEKFPQNCVPSYTFFRCGDYLKFWIGLRKVSTKLCAQLHVFAVQTILSFWMGLRKVSTEMCAQLHVFSLWRLTWVFDGTWKNFHKKVCPVTRFFAVETNLSFWWDLEKFSQKSVPSHTFLRCGDYLKFLRGLGKFRPKKCDQLHIFFAVRTILSFG